MRVKRVSSVMLPVVLSACLVLMLQHYVTGARVLKPTPEAVAALVAADAGDVKALPDGTAVQLEGKVVTYAPRNSSGARATTHFYVANPEGHWAVRVEDGPVGSDSVSVNDVLSVSGLMRTSESGERYIELSEVPDVTSSDRVKPLGVNTRTLHTDPKIPGVLVRLGGDIKQVSPDGTWFTISDGYSEGGASVATRVVIEDGRALGALAGGDDAVVTGIVSLQGTAPESAERVVLLTALWVDPKLPPPLVWLNAEGLPTGSLAAWINSGSLGGSFTNEGTGPVVQAVAGRNCVTFDGNDRMRSTFTAPAGITGNSDFTVATWAYNPTIIEQECMLCWAKRGTSGRGAQANFGYATGWGAVAHWSSAYDMGFDGGVPSAGEWHHIAITFTGSVEKVYVDGVLNAVESKTLNIWPGLPLSVGCAYSIDTAGAYTWSHFYAGSIASLQVYDTALTEGQIAALYGGQVAYSVAGRVTNQAGTPLQGAWVYFSKNPGAASNPFFTATTDASGNYRQPTGNGTWYVVAAAADHANSAERVVYVDGANVTGIDFSLVPVPTFSVSGQVTDVAGSPIAGAQVYIGKSANPSLNPAYTLTTDSSGNFSRLLANGTWYLAAKATGYDLSTDKTVVVSGTPVSNVNFALVMSGTPGVKTGPYLQAVTTTSAYVLVESESTSPVKVEWGVGTNYGVTSYTESTAATTASPATYVHRIKLTGLEPDTLYHYRVSQGGTPSGDYTFTTLAEPGTGFRFAFAADFRAGDITVHDTIAARIKAAAPRLSLYGGDLCNNSSYDSFKNEFFLPNELALSGYVPFYNTPGNHETWGTNTKAFTWGPASSSGTQAYYSFDCGDVHFVNVNTMISYGVGSAQYNWVKQDLESCNKPWKVVYTHVPAYCAGGHGENAGMVAMTQNLFVPNKVDLVIAGHSHFYQRNLVDGIHHIILGSAGAPLYDPGTASYTVVSAKSYCYGIFDVTPTSLSYKAYNQVGSQLDSLNLTKQFTVTGTVTNASGQPVYNAVVAAGGSHSDIQPVVTNSSGGYSITLPGPGSYEIYADAAGYAASFGTVSVLASGAVTRNISLNPAAENGVYNGGFEAAGTTPAGWEMFIEKPNYGTDHYGNPWPDKPSMYAFSRSTGGNSTPGGAASGLLAAVSPLSSYGVLRIDRFRVSGDACTGVTENTITDTARSWSTNQWAGCFVQLAHGTSKTVPAEFFGDYRITTHTSTVLTVEPGSNLVTRGHTAGDRYRFLREFKNYWYSGGIRPTLEKRIPVEEGRVYNFYLKQKTSSEVTVNEKSHVYALIWRDAAGVEVGRNEWRWKPSTTGFAQAVPRLFVAPPAGAATVEPCVYTHCIYNSNSGWRNSSYVDDVVVDPVPAVSVAAAKSVANGTHVVLAGNPVSLAPRDASALRCTDYFYVSTPNGADGIRVRNAGPAMDKLDVNDVVAVSGTVETDAVSGEKYVRANVLGTSCMSTGAEPESGSVAYALTDPGALGNYVSVVGQISSIAPDTSWFNITDAGSTIKVCSVDYPLLSTFASVGQTIRVLGAVSKEGANRVILMQTYTKQINPLPDNDVTFFSISDVHYGAGWMTRTMQKQRIAAMNAMPGTPYPSGIGGVVGECRGVTVSGDITDNDNDKAGQFRDFATDFGVRGNNQLRFPAYEGLGNHDGDVTYPAADGLKPRNPYRSDLCAVSPDGHNYSWDWGRVHCIQMNETGSYLNQDSLGFVESDLAANVGTSGRPVILFQHFGFDDFSYAFYSRGEGKALYDVIRNYNVIAIIWGHTGGADQYKWGGIDVFGVDGPETQFHVFHVTPTELIVCRRYWSTNSWTWTFRKPITGMQ